MASLKRALPRNIIVPKALQPALLRSIWFEHAANVIQAPPSKKLPALYVLDSIVKNVGTPYTLYFGRNLFKIFMESYAVVDNPVRRKMEEMLKTWKDPVPGSMDTRSVFSHELVRPIENALMKARAASMPQGAIPGRPRPGMMPHRNTPTPPGMRGPQGQGAYPPPGYPVHNGGQGQYPGQQTVSIFERAMNTTAAKSSKAPIYSNTTPQPAGPGQGPYQPPAGQQYATGSTGISVDKLNHDIQNLIAATKQEFSQNPHDASIQTRLKALLDLQGVVQRTSLPPDQLELIKNKVTELAAVTIKPNAAQDAPSASSLLQNLGHLLPVTQTPPPNPAGQSAAPVTLDGLLGQGALAALMARTGSNSQNSTPNPPSGHGAIQSPPPTRAEQPQPPPAGGPNNAMSLLEKLRQAGMLPPAPAAGGKPEPSPPAAAPPPFIPANIASILSAAKAGAGPFGMAPMNSSGLNEASLKQQYVHE